MQELQALNRSYGDKEKAAKLDKVLNMLNIINI